MGVDVTSHEVVVAKIVAHKSLHGGEEKLFAVVLIFCRTRQF